MQERGGQHPDGIALQSLVAGKEAGAHLDCGRSTPGTSCRKAAWSVAGSGAPGPQLLAQAAMQQAQHHVISGGTGRLGRRDALWLCPTHTPAQHPGPPAAQRPPALARPAPGLLHTAPPPTLSAPSQTPSAFCALTPLGWRCSLGTRLTHLWKAGGRTSGAAGTEATVP